MNEIDQVKRLLYPLFHPPLDLLPDCSEPDPSVFKEQSSYVQAKIIKYEKNIMAALESKNIVLLDNCLIQAGLWRPDLISLDTLGRCLAERQVRREMVEAIYALYPGEVSTDFDPNSPWVGEQAENLGLTIVAPDLSRGMYSGSCAGLDFQSSLIKFGTKKAIVLPFAAFDDQLQPRPTIGDKLLIQFQNQNVQEISYVTK